MARYRGFWDGQFLRLDTVVDEPMIKENMRGRPKR
jgi:hypothetical protein